MVAKKKKLFRPVRLESLDGEVKKGPIFNREFSEAQALARKRFVENKKRKLAARKFAYSVTRLKPL